MTETAATKSKAIKNIWITGASSGLGFALAKRYLIDGHRVFASARSLGELALLQRLYPKELTFIEFDVSTDAGIAATQACLQEHVAHLDLAILNAGTCEYVDVENMDWQMFERVNNVNYLGLVRSLQVCLPLLKKAQRGHLVGVGSQAVQAPFVRSEAYGASKAAVRYLLASLRLDLAPDSIDVTCILPGFVDTPLTQKNDFNMPFLMSPDAAADRMVKAIAQRRFEYAFPKRLSFILFLARHLPKTWFRYQARQSAVEKGSSL